MGENICKLCIWQGLNVKKKKTEGAPTTPKQKKLITRILKWAKDLNRDFFKEDVTNGRQVYEKMLKVTNHQGNASQNHLRPVRKAVINTPICITTKVENCWEIRSLVNCWWEWKMVQLQWKTVGRFHTHTHKRTST